MNLKMKIVLFLFINSIMVSYNFAQGISHSKGFGSRSIYWLPSNPTHGLNIGHIKSKVLSGSGKGTAAYLFERVNENWFLEASYGKDGGTNFVITGLDGSYVGNSYISNFLLGCRYDWLPPKYASPFQPYVASGLGLYWISKYLEHSMFIDNTIADKTELKYGIYLGSGLHIVLKSWFALNFDFKYHLINLQPVKDYSGLEFSAGVCFMSGKKKEIFKIEEIRVIVKDIYPAYYQFYSTYPLAQVMVKNTAGYPIEINVRSNIEGYSERSQESGFIKINRGEKKIIPVLALFGSKLLQSSRCEPAVLDIELEAKAGESLTKTISEQIIIHNRNAWNGEIDRLGFFVTPDDKHIMEISRKVTNQISNIYKDETNNFVMAKALFNELTNLKIRYQSDPNIPFYKDDRVQFANETRELGTGDCDDLVVLYSSLLESVGIKTAFVDVHDPEKEIAHVYLIFDSGLPPDQSSLISSNEKRFIVRKKSANKQTLWIPVETTLVEAGFNEAWKSGALLYLQEGILRDGIDKGWVRIIDVEQISNKY